MANTLKPLPVVQLGLSFAQIYRVPDAATFTCAVLHVTNTVAPPVAVRICLVPAGGTPLQANAIAWDFTVPGNGILEFFRGDMWEGGSSLQALAGSASAVNLKLSGVETT